MERELGDVGTQLLWEDDHVRTWDLVLEPGTVERLAQAHDALCVHRYESGQA